METNNTAVYDNVIISVSKETYEELKTPFMCVFNLSLSKGIFPDKLNLAKISPIF